MSWGTAGGIVSSLLSTVAEDGTQWEQLAVFSEGVTKIDHVDCSALLAEPGSLKVGRSNANPDFMHFYLFLMVYLALSTPNYYRTHEKNTK